MSDELFEDEVRLIFDREGYLSDHPADKGGRTIWGITSRDYPEDVKLMEQMGKAASRAHAKMIYRRNYFKPVGVLAIPEEGDILGAQMFDFSVTSGPGRAVKTLQRILNALGRYGHLWDTLLVDGGFGPKTLKALDFCVESGRANYSFLAEVYKAIRVAKYLDFCEYDHEQSVFIKGWWNRVIYSPKRY